MQTLNRRLHIGKTSKFTFRYPTTNPLASQNLMLELTPSDPETIAMEFTDASRKKFPTKVVVCIKRSAVIWWLLPGWLMFRERK